MTEVFESDQEAMSVWRARAKYNKAQLNLMQEQLLHQQALDIERVANRTATIIIERIREEDASS